MGGDYRAGGHPPPQKKKLLEGGRKGKRPPSIAASSNKIRLFYFSCHQTLLAHSKMLTLVKN